MCHIRDKEEFGHNKPKLKHKRKWEARAHIGSKSDSEVSEEGQIISDSDEIAEDLVINEERPPVVECSSST